MASAADHPASAWTSEAIRQLGLTTDVATAGAVLGIGRTKAYELAKNGEFRVRLLRIGPCYLVPTTSLSRWQPPGAARPHPVGKDPRHVATAAPGSASYSPNGS
jgi:hypothetical protein